MNLFSGVVDYKCNFFFKKELVQYNENLVSIVAWCLAVATVTQYAPMCFQLFRG